MAVIGLWRVDVDEVVDDLEVGCVERERRDAVDAERDRRVGLSHGRLRARRGSRARRRSRGRWSRSRCSAGSRSHRLPETRCSHCPASPASRPGRTTARCPATSTQLGRRGRFRAHRCRRGRPLFQASGRRGAGGGSRADGANAEGPLVRVSWRTSEGWRGEQGGRSIVGASFTTYWRDDGDEADSGGLSHR